MFWWQYKSTRKKNVPIIFEWSMFNAAMSQEDDIESVKNLKSTSHGVICQRR